MKRTAYSINVKTTSLDAARQYAEAEFQKAGKSLDEMIPDFDRNYGMLQKRLKGAMDIPRVSMPVIGPSDMALFNQRLNSGAVDVFAPYAKGKLYAPSSLSKDEGEEWVELGFKDGDRTDDVIKGKIGSWPVAKMKPTQSQIWLDRIVKLLLKHGPVRGGSPILNQTVIMSGDGYILDGHHRYAQAMVSDPSLKMRALRVPLPIDLLLKIGKTYGESIGNSPKASMNEEVQMDKVAEELIKVAGILMNPGAGELIADAFGLGRANVKNVKLIGSSRYKVAIGTFKGKWYGVEAQGSHPQVWEERSEKALLSKIEEDTGVKTASKSTVGALDDISGILFKMKKEIFNIVSSWAAENEGLVDDREVDQHFRELMKLVDKAAGRASTLSDTIGRASRRG